MPVILWGIFQTAMWVYAGFQLCNLFHFGRAQAASGNGWTVSLVWASVIVAVLCAVFPSVRSIVIKALAYLYRKFKAVGDAVKAEAEKTEAK